MIGRTTGRPVSITGLGVYVPERIVTNDDLAGIVDTSDAWITERTGIRERRIAADLDALRLAPGTVLLDDFLGFAMPLSSRNPTQFAITSDRDFQSILADPAGNGIRYVLVPDPVEQGRLDAVNRRSPSLYANGAGMATLVRQYPNDADRVGWRLYHLKPEANP